MGSDPVMLLPPVAGSIYDCDHARSIECPQCGRSAIWLYNEQRCFCVFCRYEIEGVELRWWDRIDIYAPIIMDGSGVAA